MKMPMDQLAVHQALASLVTINCTSIRLWIKRLCVEALSEQLGVPADQVIIEMESDKYILSMAFLAFFNNEEEVLFPDLTYGFTRPWADLSHPI